MHLFEGAGQVRLEQNTVLVSMIHVPFLTCNAACLRSAAIRPIITRWYSSAEGPASAFAVLCSLVSMLPASAFRSETKRLVAALKDAITSQRGFKRLIVVDKYNPFLMLVAIAPSCVHSA